MVKCDAYRRPVVVVPNQIPQRVVLVNDCRCRLIVTSHISAVERRQAAHCCVSEKVVDLISVVFHELIGSQVLPVVQLLGLPALKEVRDAPGIWWRDRPGLAAAQLDPLPHFALFAFLRHTGEEPAQVVVDVDVSHGDVVGVDHRLGADVALLTGHFLAEVGLCKAVVGQQCNSTNDGADAFAGLRAAALPVH